MMQFDDATQKQINAARPERSTWLSANAGSGKTRVLTDRVARLLLDQVDPQHILCLTYTKAAASEMQNRLFKRLGEWAMLNDPDLTDALQVLGYESAITSQILADARRLFARAIETPGGLKIQTIHSFCSSLLRRFPLESGVSPQFVEMDERAAAQLRSQIIEDLANGPQAEVLAKTALYFTGETLADLAAEVVRQQTVFEKPYDTSALHQHFSLDPDITTGDLIASVFLGGELELLKALIAALRQSGANDQKAAAQLMLVKFADQNALPILESVFLTKSGKTPFSAKIGSFPTKACRETLSDLMPQIEDLMRRVETAREARIALSALNKTRALYDFAQAFLPAYSAAKQFRGWLDFDDLILKARALLTNSDVAAWVLFRLDGGIDHILVDEAQDTSPVQWQVIERLAQEFTSGEGARADVLRTIFVVGDKKQSIYSFQGADPGEFDRMQLEFDKRLSSIGTPLQGLEMEYSFRSSQAILSLVDQAFQNNETSGFAANLTHKAFHADMPGRVDLWPLVEKNNSEDGPEWFQPVDVKAASDPTVILAHTIATNIRQLIDSKSAIPDGQGMRPVQAGDFLILFQKRSELFHEIIRECKAQSLPIAGADRLKIGAELAVRDLVAILSFLATPEDSLSLAIILKSPLFNWSEAQLYNLAHARADKYLWTSLRNRADEFSNVMDVLDDLRQQADYMRPYELLERILTRHDGRRLFLGRLGFEAEDGIDALLAQAIAYEQQAADSLTGFLQWMQADDLEIKRQLENSGDRIRVMTVHGAKGLEAPIVILADTAKQQSRQHNQVITQGDLAFWRTKADETPKNLAQITEHLKTADTAERNRLLYVAMTRAEKWLIVAAAGDLGKSGDTWHDKIRTAMEHLGAVEHSFLRGTGLRLEHGDWSEPSQTSEEPSPEDIVPLPDFYHQAAPNPQQPTKTLSPSELGGAKALPGDDGLDEEAAKRRGRQIHLLLEHLPKFATTDWHSMAVELLNSGSDSAQPDEISAIFAEASTVLNTSDLVTLFAENTLAEVPITATLPVLNCQRIHGVIDRLIIDEHRILAVDFKSNATVPATPQDCPEGLLRQMGAYALALSQIYPDHKIDVALLWTRTASLMSLPHDLVTDAVSRTVIP
ncbi:double-strand break repair helicase AddA [Roseovarius sp. EL26]|uniref:double-strand break repair helicase AddA n=1 Tax=Roseovarius sp. EL26 TaxID=2126672 RepID=UPI000EA1036B|nr:double-strand break repair helicase AddA [Roseovarius sp. EL26]